MQAAYTTPIAPSLTPAQIAAVIANSGALIVFANEEAASALPLDAATFGHQRALRLSFRNSRKEVGAWHRVNRTRHVGANWPLGRCT